MKLLTPQQFNDKKSQEVSRAVLRAEETNKLTEKANQALAKAEADFALALSGQRVRWEVEELDHKKKMEELLVELKPLEDRKRQALIPIEVYKKQADDKLDEANTILQEVKEKRERLEEDAEVLQDRLDEVSDRELLAIKRHERLDSMEIGLEHQVEQNKAITARLSQDLAKFISYKANEEKSLDERKTELTLAEISFKAKTDKLKRDLEALEKERILVKDQRETLERAMKRLK